MSGQLLHAKMKLSGDKPAGTDPIFLTVRCRVQRIVAALNADFTPSRKVELDFSELIFANGRHIPIHTRVTPGSGQVIQFVTSSDD